MKKYILGASITVGGALLCVGVWQLTVMAFVLEGLTRDRIGLALIMAACVPWVIYTINTVIQKMTNSGRIDGNHYQPLLRPWSLGVNLVVQSVVMVLWGIPTQDQGQAAIAFVCATILAIMMGALSLAGALILGRPVPGVTRIPFWKYENNY